MVSSTKGIKILEFKEFNKLAIIW